MNHQGSDQTYLNQSGHQKEISRRYPWMALLDLIDTNGKHTGGINLISMWIHESLYWGLLTFKS